MNGSGGTSMYLPPLSRINKYLIMTIAVLFILRSVLQKLTGFSLDVYLGLSALGFLHGLIHTLVTYPLLGQGLMEVIFSGWILWFIGADLERSWGEKRYIGFLVTSAIAGGLIYLLLSFVFFRSSPIFSYPLYGLGGVTNALCLAYAILYPDRTFLFMLIFPMKTKYFCLLLVAMQLYMGFMQSEQWSGAQAWGHLGAMLGGFMFMLAVSTSFLKWPFNRRGRSKSRAKLTLVNKDKEDDGPKYWH